VGRLVVLAALAALLAAGCGGSKPSGPPALVFVNTKDGDYAIFGADADGKNVHRLTKEKGDPSSPRGLFFQTDPAWSPDGTKIAFVSHREGTSHVYVMDADGTGTRRLTDSNQDDSRPSWSPDGTRIAFSREGALFAIPSDGGPVRRVVRALGNADNPAWSPDGTWIAYDYRRPGYSIREVYMTQPDGTHAHPVTGLREVSSRPAWSPDGKELAFQSNAHGGHTEIYKTPAAGGTPGRLTISDTDAIQPAWSPTGDIAFSRGGAIWLSDDGKETKLTSGENNDSAPAWNPRPPK
jgi:TolB protein